jgi:PKD repeat protein
MAPDKNGTAIDFTSGNIQTVELDVTLDASWPIEDCEFIAILQNKTPGQGTIPGTSPYTLTKWEVYQSVKRGVIDLFVDFSASDTEIGKGETVDFTNLTSGGYIGVPETYDWSFPGGTPMFSSAKNPTVTYNNCGPHDVTLIVDRGGQIDTVMKTHYIQVGPVVEITTDPGDSACWYQPITLDAAIPTGTAYLWSPGGETTPSITVDGNTYGYGTHTFSVTVTSADGCEQTVSHDIYFDECTGIGEPAQGSSASIFPNPNNGKFTMVLEGKGTNDLRILNLLGTTVYEERGLSINGKVTRSLDLNLSSGLYYLIVQNSEGKTIRKFSVTK